ncbi:MAG: ABC transporter substrate-binding protein [Chitinophagales bacterium]
MRSLIIYAVGFVLLFSCQQNQSHDLTIFKYNQASGITSLDPAFAKNQANIWAVSQLFNGLVQLDSNLQIQPCIAREWEMSEDGLTFTFHLRDDVFFHDSEHFEEGKGRQVVAQDFVYSFSRIVDEKTASSGAWIFNGKIDDEIPFLAIDDKTFQLKLAQPFRPILGILAMPYCFAVPHEVVDFYGKDFRANPVGTGPFYLKVWEEGTALVALKNEQYFETVNDEKLPYLDGFKCTFVENKKMVRNS